MSRDRETYHVRYHLQGEGHHHIVCLTTDKEYFNKFRYGDYLIEIRIMDMLKLEHVDFHYCSNGRLASRRMCEIRTKDFERIKRWINLIEEISDYAPYHGYNTDAVMKCIESYIQHIDTEVERYYAQKTAKII